MKKNILNRLLLLTISISAIACGPKKVVITRPPVSDTVAITLDDKKAENIARLQSKDLLFRTLSLRGKARLAINGNENNVTMQIRIEKDKKIWLSISAPIVGEAARALITPDSLFLRNNMERTYTKKPFSYVYQFTNKQLNFGLLQALLSGNTMPEFTTVKSELSFENEGWVLSGVIDKLTYRSKFNSLPKVAETTISDVKAAQALKVEYGDYTLLNGILFPSGIKINSMAGTKTIMADLSFTRIEANVPVDFPFTVPKSYELIN